MRQRCGVSGCEREVTHYVQPTRYNPVWRHVYCGAHARAEAAERKVLAVEMPPRPATPPPSDEALALREARLALEDQTRAILMAPPTPDPLPTPEPVLAVAAPPGAPVVERASGARGQRSATPRHPGRPTASTDGATARVRSVSMTDDLYEFYSVIGDGNVSAALRMVADYLADHEASFPDEEPRRQRP